MFQLQKLSEIFQNRNSVCEINSKSVKYINLGNKKNEHYTYSISYEISYQMEQKTICNFIFHREEKKNNNKEEEAVVVDKYGRFVNFPGIILEEKLSEKPMRDLVGKRLMIEPFQGDYAVVCWTILQGNKWEKYYSLLDQRGRLIVPFSKENKKKRDQRGGVYYLLKNRNGWNHKIYVNKEKTFYINGKAYENIQGLRSNPCVLYDSNRFPCFDSHDYAHENRYDHYYLICESAEDAQNLRRQYNRKKDKFFRYIMNCFDHNESRYYLMESDTTKGFVLEEPQDKPVEEGIFVAQPFLPRIEIDYEIVDSILVKYHGCQTAVNIPEGIKVIGESAFEDCAKIRRIILPQSLIKIEGKAFKKCKCLERLVIPDSVTELPFEMCAYCESLENITCSKKLKQIGNRVFMNCRKLQEICLPSTIIKIGDWAFDDCSNLEKIVIPDSVCELGNAVFGGCKKLRKVVLPVGLKKIPEQTFSFCNSLEEIELPEGITDIEKKAFFFSGLRRMVLPSTVVNIGEDCFDHCRSLEITYYEHEENAAILELLRSER